MKLLVVVVVVVAHVAKCVAKSKTWSIRPWRYNELNTMREVVAALDEIVGVISDTTSSKHYHFLHDREEET
jgi:hypothetical protein